jgi:hypothetical protein
MRLVGFTLNYKPLFMLLLLLEVVQSSLSASTLWAWEYSTSQAVASGTMLTSSSPEASGGYLITDLTGARNGKTITGLQPPGMSIPGNEPFTVDNLLFPDSEAKLTGNGFGFSLSDGTFSNPFFADFLPTPGYLEFFSNPGVGSTELEARFSATLLVTPEPTLLNPFLEVVALALFLVKRRRALGAELILTRKSIVEVVSRERSI